MSKAVIQDRRTFRFEYDGLITNERAEDIADMIRGVLMLLADVQSEEGNNAPPVGTIGGG